MYLGCPGMDSKRERRLLDPNFVRRFQSHKSSQPDWGAIQLAGVAISLGSTNYGQNTVDGRNPPPVDIHQLIW